MALQNFFSELPSFISPKYYIKRSTFDKPLYKHYFSFHHADLSLFPFTLLCSLLPIYLHFLLFYLPPLCPLFSSSSHPYLCPRSCMCQCRPTPAIIKYPVEVHSPTPPTMDQNGDKAPSTKPHICSVPVQDLFFFLQRMSVMSVARQQCLWNKLLNCLASFLLCF